jgi:AhpD family alkylhydroperoxidase
MNDALAALRPPVARHPFPSRDPTRPKGLNVLGTLARYPALTHAFHTFTGHVLFATTLSPRHRELLVLRVAAVRGCEYEWAQHEVLARDAGVTEDEIAAVARYAGDDEAWARADAALLAAAGELVATARIADETWAALRDEFDDQQLMDVVFTVGVYDTLAMAMLSFELDLDDDLPRGNALLLKRDR